MIILYIDYLIKRIGWGIGFYRLRRYEIEILDNWSRTLPELGQSTLQEQLKILKYCYRQSSGQMVHVRQKKTLHVASIPDHLKFPLWGSGLEFPVASINCSSVIDSVRCDIYLYDGALLQLTFDKPPKRFFKQVGVSFEGVTFQVSPLVDPTRVEVFDSDHSVTMDNLPLWLKEVAEKHPIRLVRGPLSDPLWDRYLAFYDVKLPEDYLEWTKSYGEEIEVGDCCVYGLSAMRSYVTPLENYYVAVEIGTSGILCFIRNAESGVYYVDSEDLMPVYVGSSFKAALLTAITDPLSWRGKV